MSNVCVANNTVMVKRLLVVSDDSTLFTLHILSVYNPLFFRSLQLLFPVISNIKTWLSTTLVPYTVFQSTGWQERTNFANLIFEFLWELVIIWEAISNTPFSVSPDIHKGGSRGRVKGVRTPHPPEMTCGFLKQLVFCQKKTMWFTGVEVEQETSEPPPKKNPGSAPDPDTLKFRLPWCLRIGWFNASHTSITF